MNTTATEQDYADTLVWFLNDASGWTTRNELRSNLHYTDRDIRMARAAAGCGLVISCTKGYKATKNATDTEVREARTMYAGQRDAAQRSVGELDAVIFARHKAEIESLTAVVGALKARRPVDVYAAISALDGWQS